VRSTFGFSAILEKGITLLNPSRLVKRKIGVYTVYAPSLPGPWRYFFLDFNYLRLCKNLALPVHRVKAAVIHSSRIYLIAVR